MQKVIYLLVALLCSMSMNAQVIKVMKNGEVVKSYTTAEADNVIFDVIPIKGTAKRTGNIDVTWVQLWEDGPKFAEYNVGAENDKAQDNGGYYSWGGSQDKVDCHNTGTDVLTGDNDTATKLWGGNWRMPTMAELQALLDNCTAEWTAENCVYGRKFTGKGDYSCNSIFLPASGYFFDEVIVPGGNYWSSVPLNNNTAFILDFKSDSQNVSSNARGYGCPVRAVLMEN